jgi:hypothetical protein
MNDDPLRRPFPVNTTEEINAIAVALGKAENMRVSAAQRYAALWEYVRTPGNDGAQQVIDAGHEPTQAGLWAIAIVRKNSRACFAR